MKLIRALVDNVKHKLAGEPAWEFERPQVKIEERVDPRRAAEQARQIKLGYSVEIVNKGEGVRYTEGLRYVEANVAWASGARVWIGTLREWNKPERRDMTIAEFTKALSRICEYLGCDGTEVTLIDDAAALRLEDVVVADAVLPKVAGWRRLERGGAVIQERAAVAA